MTQQIEILMPKAHANNPAKRDLELAKALYDSASKPFAWLYVGRHLRSSADALLEREGPIATKYWDELRRIERLGLDHIDGANFPAPNLDAAALLIAFAIENFLKGLMVANGKVKFSEQKLPAILKTHDLSELHKLAKPAATVAQHLLDSFTYMSEWRARYPIPISAEDFWPMRPNRLSWPIPYAEILDYCNRIEAELQALV
jgi:hypothetical protein